MNAKELMIKDWYANSDGDYCKVVKTSNNIVWGQGEDVADSTDDPNPILLTPKILEKNEFQLILSSNGKTIYSLLLGTENCSSVIFLLIDEEKWKLNVKNRYSKKLVDFISYNNTLYVHELQHALRLCRLDELADNFKVMEE